jgi:periplasmic divalent cation tolerance protein
MDELVMLYTTFSDADEARTIARTLVEARLVACANIQAPHTAIYHWQDEVREDSEVAVWFKTKRELVVHASERIKAMHASEIPCVVALPIQAGNADFLEWIYREAG